MKVPQLLVRILPFLPYGLAGPALVERAASPTVTLASSSATIVGNSSGQLDSFKGIPFAEPPTGPLRLKPPRPLNSPLGTFLALEDTKSCPQFFGSVPPEEIPEEARAALADTPVFQSSAVREGEDCLTLNVFRPAGTNASDKLPVVVWIYGGGFELGSTSMYDFNTLINSSIDVNMPLVFVAMNYRVAGFGFMPGKEILADGSSNLGLLDQRLALEWVADNIGAFGGDPAKVIIWGESAGSISVYDQMLLYDGNHTYHGKPLFRGAIMNSGSIIPSGPIDGVKGQAIYDSVVEFAGCSSHADTLKCLRGLAYADFLAAANSVPPLFSYHSVALSYLPRPDGTVLTDSPEALAKAGKYARVPFILGSQEDEGTLFALFQSNISTTEQIIDYFQEYYFLEASREQITGLVESYPDSIAEGSPFRTFLFNNWYPQFKRLAAILGDIAFTLTRRATLEITAEVSPEVKTWSYLSSYNYGLAILGTFHGSDIIQVFNGIWDNYAARSTHTYYFSFAYDLDPNARRGLYREWPQWDNGQQLMQFYAHGAGLLRDTFRPRAAKFLKDHFAFLRF